MPPSAYRSHVRSPRPRRLPASLAHLVVQLDVELDLLAGQRAHSKCRSPVSCLLYLLHSTLRVRIRSLAAAGAARIEEGHSSVHNP
jgi:hypothetical protein